MILDTCDKDVRKSWQIFCSAPVKQKRYDQSIKHLCCGCSWCLWPPEVNRCRSSIHVCTRSQHGSCSCFEAARLERQEAIHIIFRSRHDLDFSFDDLSSSSSLAASLCSWTSAQSMIWLETTGVPKLPGDVNLCRGVLQDCRKYACQDRAWTVGMDCAVQKFSLHHNSGVMCLSLVDVPVYFTKEEWCAWVWPTF